MKNKSTYRKLKIPIDNVLEIRLPYLTWKKIKWVAVGKNRSCSWVVRYTIFRMIKRHGPLHRGVEIAGARSKKIAKLNEQVREERMDSKKKHRHRLCLYGQDELFIRIAAAKMGCSMTHLVRLALALYLDDLVRKFPSFGRSRDYRGRFNSAAWRCLGIKIYLGVRFHTKAARHQLFEFTHYKPSDYW
ncbi:MAG: hypothetical protein ABUK01_14785 [Leptospirales bacterium]